MVCGRVLTCLPTDPTPGVSPKPANLSEEVPIVSF